MPIMDYEIVSRAKNQIIFNQFMTFFSLNKCLHFNNTKTRFCPRVKDIIWNKLSKKLLSHVCFIPDCSRKNWMPGNFSGIIDNNSFFLFYLCSFSFKAFVSVFSIIYRLTILSFRSFCVHNNHGFLGTIIIIYLYHCVIIVDHMLPKENKNICY